MPKFWIISDTHFGVRNNSKKWEDLIRGWADNFLYPLFDREVSPDDILVHCGDVFDNRQSVGLSSMSFCIEFFEKLSGYFSGIRVLCGNHDAYYTSKNDIASVDCLKYIPGVRVVKEPETCEIFGKRVMFVPWTENPDDFNMPDCRPDILFCHAEFGGCVMNASGTKSESRLRAPDISRIYTGHIHHCQKRGRVTFVGSPYQLTQNDRNNRKCVYSYDPENDKEYAYPNTFSPEFIRVKYENVSGMPLGEFRDLCRNRFVEIAADPALAARCRFQKLASLAAEDDPVTDITFVPSGDNPSAPADINISECASVSEMLDRYIDEAVICDAKTKESVRAISKKLIHG